MQAPAGDLPAAGEDRSRAGSGLPDDSVTIATGIGGAQRQRAGEPIGPAGQLHDGTGRGAYRRGKRQADLVQERHEIARPSHRDRRGAERVFQDEIPADHPGDELT